MIEVKPFKDTEASKREQIEQMFDDIAPRYDLLNRSLSLGIDQLWRKKAIASLKDINPGYILDVATGTADLAIEALKLNPRQVTGIDISARMLGVGKAKIASRGLADKITLMQADSTQLPFDDNKFDAVTVGFGVRNFEFLQQGIDQMYRVTRKGGRLAILEFSQPKGFPFRQLYHFYFRFILPAFGGLVSKSRSAYQYLPESVAHFPEGAAFAAYLEKAGYKNIRIRPLSFGICTLYTAIK